MRILILGGTRFVGRHIVTECLERGHDVTLICRGRTPSPFVGVVRHVLTDRRAPTQEARRVLGESWDVLIDTSARDTDDLTAVVPHVKNASRYLLLSTCGVYSRNARGIQVITEQARTIRADATDPVRATATGKLHCERFLHRRLHAELLILRLGLVIGPHDYSQRLAYWLERALRGGPTLVPMDPRQPLQLVDVRDVARYVLSVGDSSQIGTVNVAGPPTGAADLVAAIRSHTNGTVEPHWIPEEFALAHGLRPWTEVPLWLPASSPERALMSVSTACAEQTGLAYRPLADSIADCLAWQAVGRSWSQQWLDRPRELQLIEEWRR